MQDDQLVKYINADDRGEFDQSHADAHLLIVEYDHLLQVIMLTS